MIETERSGQLQPRDLKQFLQLELLKRCEKNPSYSLRAFAKNLGIYHATLSALIKGKRPITALAIKKLAEPLGLTPHQVETFIEATKKQKSNHLKVTKKTTEENYRELTLDTFMATSEWYYDAILELIHLKEFKPESMWIAKRLGLSVNQVNIAIERLVRLEIISIENDGSWKALSRNTSTIIHNDFTTTALRKYQKNILELSGDALNEIAKPLRDHTSMTVAIQRSDLNKAKELIKKFRRDLTSYLQRDGVKPDEVYQLALSFFPLTKSLKKQGVRK